MRNFHNRLTKLENTSPQNLAGVIIYMSNVIYESSKDEKGHTQKDMISGDFRMHKENANVLSLEEMNEYVKDHGHTHITFLPVRQKPEDIQFVELHHDI